MAKRSTKTNFSDIDAGLNTPTDKIIENVRRNIRRPLPQLKTYAPQDRELLILAGGPSMKQDFGTIAGMLHTMNPGTLCVNGAYGYMVDQGYEPGIMCMLDAREWNTRFLDKIAKGTKFFLASQCDPSAFDRLEEAGADTFIWQSPIPVPKGERKNSWKEGRKLYNEYYFDKKNYLIVPGGVTVTAKSIMIGYWLGFRKIHMFGFDSCWMGDEHHSYDQPENNDKQVKFWFTGDDRKFTCAPWMAHQADSFFKLAPHLPDNLDLKVWGDGLIAHGLKKLSEGELIINIE